MCDRLGVTRQGFYAWRNRPPCERRIRRRRLHGGDQTHPHRVTWHLWCTADPRRACRRLSDPLRPQTRRPPDAQRWPGGLSSPQAGMDDETQPRRCAGPGSGETRLHRDRRRTACGSPTSPTCRRGPGSATSPPCWTCSVVGSSAGRSPTTCAPSSSSTPSTWPSSSAGRLPELIHHSDQGTQYTSIETSGAAAAKSGSRSVDGIRRRLLRQLDGRVVLRG